MATCYRGCPRGQRLDPAFMCGDCLTQKEIYEKYYPQWADPYDVQLAATEGFNAQIGPRWKLCPFDSRIKEMQCGNGRRWNELACECFELAKCKIGCPMGTELDPTQRCSCEDIKEIRKRLYPDWATEDDIRSANDAMYNRPRSQPLEVQLERPDTWPKCEPYFRCEVGQMKNELACQCFAAITCASACGKDFKLDPVGGCKCISD